MTTSESRPATLTRSWDEVIPPVTRVRIAIVTGLLLLAYWGVVRSNLIARWIHDDNWSHGWLIPLFSIYFLISRREQLLNVRPKPNYLGIVVLTLSLSMYFLSAWVLRMGYPQAVSIVGAILGVTLLMGGWPVMRIAWFPILFLLFAIPLPQSMYVSMTMPLRECASTVAAAVMPLLAPGLHTEAQAVVIDYSMPGYGIGQLNVDEACSGMRSLMAFVTLGVAMAYIHERPAWHRGVMLVCCIPLAVFCNTIRVTATGLLYVYGHRDLAQGTPHALLGVVMFAIALGLFMLIGYVLNHLVVEEPDERP